MALVNLFKFATFAFLICTMVSTFGSGAEMVIKEVVTNIDEKCSKNGEMCFSEKGIYCCEGLSCLVLPPLWPPGPPEPGQCIYIGPLPLPQPQPQTKLLTKQPLCAHKGQRCFPEIGLTCCEALLCKGGLTGFGKCV